MPVHGARQVDPVVEADGDRRVLRHADQRTRHLAVEAVHRERVAVDRATHEHRGEVERVAVRETRDAATASPPASVDRIDARAGEKRATGGVSPTSPGIIGMPFGIGIGIAHVHRHRVRARARRAWRLRFDESASCPACLRHAGIVLGFCGGWAAVCDDAAARRSASTPASSRDAGASRRDAAEERMA